MCDVLRRIAQLEMYELQFAKFTSFLLTFNVIICKGGAPGNLTDFNVCKVSHMGIDYVGQIGRTESLSRCQSWTSANPIHKVNPAYTDDTFSDFSKNAAKHYCRNPSKDPLGPWCYTMDVQLINETCAIPLCSYTECRLTGPGMEYGGTHNTAASDKKCLKWNKKRNRVLVDGKFVKVNKYPKYNFPENDLSEAGKRCRNPDGDPSGPWCFVEIEGSNDVQKEYCDIPFCNEPDCTFLTKYQNIYSHYTEFDSKNTEITFGIKVWNPDTYMDAKATILLSLFTLPLAASTIGEGGFGIEVHISNTKTGLPVGNAEKPVPENTPQLLKSTEYTYFTLSWGGSFITLNKVGKGKPIFIAQYQTKKNLLAYKKDKFLYYAVKGDNLLWAIPYCNEDGKCNIHTTTSSEYQRFWPLGVNNVGHDLRFFVRAFHTAKLMLVQSPTADYPKIEVILDSLDNFTRILLTKFKDSPSVTLYEMSNLKLLDYWNWREFSFNLFANTLSFYKSRETGTFLLQEVIAEEIRVMRWFSISSLKSVAHWTFFCQPDVASKPPQAWLPECSLDTKEMQYNGTQSVTADGLPCLPWASDKVFPKGTKKYFSDADVFKAWNYCRDPTKEGKGTFCYAIKQEKIIFASKTFCKIRQCKSADCKTAGTGNDYIGKVSTTRSNRTCQFWSAKPPHVGTRTGQEPSSDARDYFSRMFKPRVQPNGPSSDFEHLLNMHNITIYKDVKSGKDIMFVHVVRPQYMNDSLYADMAVAAAENYCRNPDRNIGGESY